MFSPASLVIHYSITKTSPLHKLFKLYLFTNKIMISLGTVSLIMIFLTIHFAEQQNFD